MVAVLKQEQDTDLQDTIVEYVQAGVDDGQDLRVSAEAAVRRVRADGQGEALLDLFGARIAMEVWRYKQRIGRLFVPQSDGHAGTPRVNDAVLTSKACMMEMQFPIAAGHWVSLGDVDETGARVLLVDYGQRASGIMAWVRFFQRIEAGLKRTGKTVRQRWTEDELLALRAETLKGEKEKKDRGHNTAVTQATNAANGKAGGQDRHVAHTSTAAQPVPVGAN